eukprot:gene51760-63283_t
MLLWAGSRHLRELPPAPWLVAAPGLLWLAAGLWPGFYATDAWRVAVSSLVIATVSLGFAHGMFRLPRSGLPHLLARMIAVLAILYAVTYLFRLFLPTMLGSIAINLPMVIIGGTLFLAISFLALTLGQLDAVEREALLEEAARLNEVGLLAEGATREAEALRAGRAGVEPEQRGREGRRHLVHHRHCQHHPAYDQHIGRPGQQCRIPSAMTRDQGPAQHDRAHQRRDRHRQHQEEPLGAQTDGGAIAHRGRVGGIFERRHQADGHERPERQQRGG